MIKLVKKILFFTLRKILGQPKFVAFENRRVMKKFLKHNQSAKGISHNSIYKNKHQGERCFVLGNGPSLKTQDLTLLEHEFVFTVNQISRHKDFEKIKPTYHFWADPIFFHLDLSKESDKELLEKMKSVNTSENHPVCFYEFEAYDMVKQTCLDKAIDIAYYKCGQPFQNVFDGEIDMATCMPGFDTVVQYAIAAAIYMGFSEIYFLGCDSTSILTSVNIRLNENLNNDYAYEVTQNENKRMRERVDKVSFEQELYSFYKVISDYKLLYKYCEQRGIKLYNCTPGGLVEGVPRKKFETLFEESIRNE